MPPREQWHSASNSQHSVSLTNAETPEIGSDMYSESVHIGKTPFSAAWVHHGRLFSTLSGSGGGPRSSDPLGCYVLAIPNLD